MTGGRNEVEQRMNTLVFESGVTLDSRFLGEDVVILLLKIADDRRKRRFVIDVVAKAGRITDRQTDRHPVFVQFDRLLLHLDVGGTFCRILLLAMTHHSKIYDDSSSASEFTSSGDRVAGISMF